MCGFAGAYAPPSSRHSPAFAAQRMAQALVHRGPDDAGGWQDEAVGLGLSHLRLSILDTSEAGHQPMLSADQRYALVFNGQIYNHLALRRSLAAQGLAPAWRGHCDTETLLACVAAWGLIATLQSAVGMFALALWDRHDKTLWLARDRLGEKPLYYGWHRGSFLFASELKALKRHPDWQADINRDALALYLRYNCVPAPHSIYRDIFKLLPGHTLGIPLEALHQAYTPAPQAYWTVNDAVQNGLAQPFSGSPEEAVDQLESALTQAVGEQMLADVPVGAFLSGGIDSSLIVALMQAQSAKPVQTFTIGFNDQAYNEATHACAVARHLGTEHAELYASPADALALIPSLAHIYCEPHSANSQIPALLVSRLAGRHVKVALTGDGGDELFGGYNRYLLAFDTWSRTQRLAPSIRKLLSNGIRLLPPQAWDRLFRCAGFMLPRQLRIATPGNHAHKLAGVLDQHDGQSYYRHLVSHCANPATLVKDAAEPATLLSDSSRWPKTDNLRHWMMAMDTQTYLSDEVLAKVDRAAMASSLETRVPLLNHGIVEMAWRMPLEYKIRGGEGKWLLRQVLHRHVPRSIMDRPKMGFGVPLGNWLRGPLREWAEELIGERRLRQEGYFHPEPIRSLWARHLQGAANVQYALWDVLMFQAWLAHEQT